MNELAFDTHKFVKDMTSEGMPEGQAAALVRFWTALAHDRLATQDDLKHLEERLGLRMDALQEEMKHLEERLGLRMDALEQRLDAKMDSVKQELDARMDALEKRLDAQMEALKQQMDLKMDALRKDILFKVLGGQMAATIAIVGLIKYL